ncbi:MAG: ATP-binding domain-containing protein [Deltaproteobacteria bacterium]|nr:ATP-binding domain-containing protein [Deltaproteobacteria bacterium]
MSDPADKPDGELPSTVRDEQKVLDRVLESLRARIRRADRRDYDAELITLRDQLAEARLEDAPPLIAQMERLQAVAARRQEVPDVTIDARSPYFAHLRLKEEGRVRDVCLGRGTYLDPEHGVRVVDWRNAPVSRIYYRYQEGEAYEESFGDRQVDGEVLVRRDVTIVDGQLMRIGASEATYVRGKQGWRALPRRATMLAGGQGTAVLPNQQHGVLGAGMGEEGLGRRDRFLPEIAALLDPKQFEAISRPAAGVVVIQGGAGSGKTTIGLHRIAYLAYQAPKRFTPDRVIVVVPSKALASYTSRVLPSLDVPHVPVVTLSEWQRDARIRALPSLPTRVTDETPLAAVKLKKHPGLLAALERKVDELAASVDAELRQVCETAPPNVARPILAAWDVLAPSALSARAAGVRKWMHGTLPLPVGAPPPASGPRIAIDHTLVRLQRRTKDVVSMWADLLTDRTILDAIAAAPTPNGLSPLGRADVEEAHRWCTRRCEAVLHALGMGDEEKKRPEEAAPDRERAELRDERRDAFDEEGEPPPSGRTSGDEGGRVLDVDAEVPRGRRRPSVDDDLRPAYRDDDDESRGHDDDASRPKVGIDNRPVDEDEELGPALDAEDDAIFLRLHQRLRGPLRGKGKTLVQYEHAFIDEVQDCASIDLKVLVECVHVLNGERSMTLAGDVAQRLTLDVGLGEFAPALEALGLPHVEVEPLQIGYRSTRQVLELAREVLGPLAPEVPPIATRDGAPIERHRFHDQGTAAAFLAAVLRELFARESMASVALITRYAWQADVYWDVLSQSEVPNLRRVRVQDFPFKPGVDLTDVRQVKGLEWDYVVLLDVNAQSYPAEDDARHLLHIAATRAAHQLWLVATGEPSPIVGGWDE